MRFRYFLTAVMMLPTFLKAQCDSTIIDNSNWTILYSDSEELIGEGANNGNATHCIDSISTTFWHTQWQGAQPNFPHEIQINLGDVYPVNGIKITSRIDNPFGKINDYEVYLSLDGINWSLPQKIGAFVYPSINAAAQSDSVYFGAVNAQYVRLIGLSSATNNYYAVISELAVYQNLTCGATGQMNQIVNFPELVDKLSTDGPFALEASSNSGLPINYQVISGPATISGNTVSLTGEAGTVVIKATQSGNVNYYSAESIRSFVVFDLSTYFPVISTKLVNSISIEMPELYAYPIYSNATIELDQFNSIVSMEYQIDGVVLSTELQNNSFVGWWTPEDFGVHTIILRATGSNGNVSEDTLVVNVTNVFSSNNVQTFNGDVINYNGPESSRWFYGSYNFPQFVGAYNLVIANFSVTCPAVSGGCDDWDRLAYVEYKSPNGSWMELFRYVTPYGVACNHSIDVTDYMSMLQGKTELRMFIDTWGSGGWSLHLDFDFQSGNPEFLYSSVTELWHGNYNFGNPTNLQPCDSLSVLFPEGTLNSKLRVTTTGHGWGDNNTGNAAEFFHATHDFLVNGQNTFTQNLWNVCNPNPDNCTGQMGTWQYNRAGWCPGIIAPPQIYDLTPFISNTPIEVLYQFQLSYMDNCHPNNPDCISGVTCNDCNAGYNPFYRIGAYVINSSNDPLALGKAEIEESKFDFGVYPNPSNNHFNVLCSDDINECVLEIKSVSGETHRTYFFKDSKALNAYLFDVSNLSSGIYFVQIKTTHQASVIKLIVE